MKDWCRQQLKRSNWWMSRRKRCRSEPESGPKGRRDKERSAIVISPITIHDKTHIVHNWISGYSSSAARHISSLSFAPKRMRSKKCQPLFLMNLCLLANFQMFNLLYWRAESFAAVTSLHMSQIVWLLVRHRCDLLNAIYFRSLVAAAFWLDFWTFIYFLYAFVSLFQFLSMILFSLWNRVFFNAFLGFISTSFCVVSPFVVFFWWSVCDFFPFSPCLSFFILNIRFFDMPPIGKQSYQYLFLNNTIMLFALFLFLWLLLTPFIWQSRREN